MQHTLAHSTSAHARQTGARNVPIGFKRYCFALAAITPLATVVVDRAANAHEYVKPAPWSDARAALGRWAGLSAVADDHGLVRPTDAALAAGRRFIRQAEARGVSAPVPYIDEDGEFGFRWQTASGFGSVAFMQDGNLVVYAHEQGSDVPPLEIDEPVVNFETFESVIARFSQFA